MKRLLCTLVVLLPIVAWAGGPIITTGSGPSVTDGNTDADFNTVTATEFIGPLTGNADTVTTNANLTGIVTSVGNATAIADKAIATAKLADGTDGQLITWDANGVIAHVATGTATHVLTSNGADTAPTFQAAAAGGIGSYDGTNMLISSDGSAGEDLSGATSNILLGENAGLNMTSGDDNIAIGRNAIGTAITTGSSNISIGLQSGIAITTGAGNTIVGDNSGNGLSTGSDNTILGPGAGDQITTADNTIAIGHNAMGSSGGVSGTDNIAIGQLAGNDLTSGTYNIFQGYNAGANITGGDNNIAIGQGALDAATSTASNTVAIGLDAMGAGTVTGNDNVAVGKESGSALTSGAQNIAIGRNAGHDITTGAQNTMVGYSTGNTINFATGSNTMALGNGANPSSNSVDNEITLGDSNIATIRAQVTSITALSDRRDKADIRPLEAGLGFINKLKPSSWRWDVRDWYFDDVEVPVEDEIIEAFTDKYGELHPEEVIKKDPVIVRNIKTSDGSKTLGYRVMGFVSQEVIEAKEGETEAALDNLILDTNPEKLELKMGDILVPLVKAVQELSAAVDAHQTTINALSINYNNLKLAFCAESPASAFCK